MIDGLIPWAIAVFASLFAALMWWRKPVDGIRLDLPSEPPLEGPERPSEPGTVPSTVEVPGTVPTVPESDPSLSWETQKGAFKLTRIMCDEEGLTYEQKEKLCACIYQESRFRNRLSDGSPVINENRKDGKVWSTDYGIVQVNDYWHIGAGKTFPSVDYVMNNPDRMVRWMVLEMKSTGRLQPWSSYVSGAYEQWLSPDSPMDALRS